jgi:hypothetical protein
MYRSSTPERGNDQSLARRQMVPATSPNAEIATRVLESIAALTSALTPLVQQPAGTRDGDMGNRMPYNDPPRGGVVEESSTVIEQQDDTDAELAQLDWRVLGRHENGVRVAVAASPGCTPSWRQIIAALMACQRKLQQAHLRPEMVGALPRVRE